MLVEHQFCLVRAGFPPSDAPVLDVVGDGIVDPIVRLRAAGQLREPCLGVHLRGVPSLVAYDAEVKRLERVGTVDVDAGVPRIRTGSVADVTPLLELPPVRFTLRGEPFPTPDFRNIRRHRRLSPVTCVRKFYESLCGCMNIGILANDAQ